MFDTSSLQVYEGEEADFSPPSNGGCGCIAAVLAFLMGALLIRELDEQGELSPLLDEGAQALEQFIELLMGLF